MNPRALLSYISMHEIFKNIKVHREAKGAVESFSIHFSGVLKNSQVLIELINVQRSQLCPIKMLWRSHDLKSVR